MANILADAGTGDTKKAGLTYRNRYIGIEWAAARWVVSLIGAAMKSQPVHTQAHGPYGHAISWFWTSL
jgi:hypothetical protein